MDSELMSCPTCSHTVSNAAGACTYCGAMMVKAKQQPPAENKVVGQTAPIPESPPPLPPVQSRPAGEMSEVAVAGAESPVSHPGADSPAVAASPDPTTDLDVESEIELLYFEDEPEDAAPDDEQVAEAVAEIEQAVTEFEIAAETALAEAVETETAADATAVAQPKAQEPAVAEIPLVETTISPAQQEDAAPTATSDVLPPPEPETVDTAADDTGNPEKVEEPKVEQIRAEAAQPETEAPLPNEKSAASAEPVEKVQTKPDKASQPKNATVIDIKTGEVPKSTGETILLDLSTEVAPAAAAPPAANAAAAQPKPKAQIQNINTSTADTSKADALKQQKAALAKAQALKKQKLVRARAAALKRKKAAQAKALAGGTAAKSQKTAAPPVSTKPSAAAGASLRMHTLIEKYKGRVIGINYDNSAEIRGAQLVQVNAEFFSVFVKDKGLRYSYPISAILTVIEGKEGVDIDNAKQVDKFIAVFKLYPLVLF